MEREDYVVFYGKDDRVVGVVASQQSAQDMCYYNEAIRLDLMPTMDQLRKGRFGLQDIKEELKGADRSGCFRDLIYQSRFKVNVKDSIWVKRQVADDYYDAVAKGYESLVGGNMGSDNGM